MRTLTLPLHIRRMLLEDEKDILTSKVEERAQKYGKPCPRCGGAVHQHLAGDRPFTNVSVLPRTLARCVDCGHEVDTQTGLITNTGNPAKVKDPFPIIDPKKDD